MPHKKWMAQWISGIGFENPEVRLGSFGRFRGLGSRRITWGLLLKDSYLFRYKCCQVAWVMRSGEGKYRACYCSMYSSNWQNPLWRWLNKDSGTYWGTFPSVVKLIVLDPHSIAQRVRMIRNREGHTDYTSLTEVQRWHSLFEPPEILRECLGVIEMFT